MHKTFTAIFIIDSLAAAFVVVQSFMLTFAQVTIPAVSNQWQLIAFVALLAFNAYALYVQNQKLKETQVKIQETSAATQGKVEEVHHTVNSQLDKFKEEAAARDKVALEQAVAVVRLTLERAADVKTSALEARIASLESKLDTERLKAVALAASMAKPVELSGKVEISPPSPLSAPSSP
jgi:hypothetical protein